MQLYWRSTKNPKIMADFLQKGYLVLSKYQKGFFVCVYCIHFVEGPSSLTKSLNKINLIEINLETSGQN